MKKTYFITLSSFLYVGNAFSATPTCEQMPTCEDLGYSATISDSCENVLSCPFDTNYKICLDCQKRLAYGHDCMIGDVFYSDGSCGDVNSFDNDGVHIPVGVVFMLTDEDGNIVTTETSNHGRVVNLHDLYAQDNYLFDATKPYEGAQYGFFWGLRGDDTSLHNYLSLYDCGSVGIVEALQTAIGQEGKADIYDGKNNTKVLAELEVCTDSDAITYAQNCISPVARASLAFYPPEVSPSDSLVGAGKWYLPSMGELIQMYGYTIDQMIGYDGTCQTIGATGEVLVSVRTTLTALISKKWSNVQTIHNSFYYSSTEVHSINAWSLAMVSGYRHAYPKSSAYRVRPILAF